MGLLSSEVGVYMEHSYSLWTYNPILIAIFGSMEIHLMKCVHYDMIGKLTAPEEVLSVRVQVRQQIQTPCCVLTVLSVSSGVLLLYWHLWLSWGEAAHLRHHRSRSRQHYLHCCFCESRHSVTCCPCVCALLSVNSAVYRSILCLPAVPGGEGWTENSAPSGTERNGSQRSDHDHFSAAGEWKSSWFDIQCFPNLLDHHPVQGLCHHCHKLL